LLVLISEYPAMNIKHLAQTVTLLTGRVPQPFPRDTTGLPEAVETQIIELENGNTFDLRATIIRKQIGDANVKMLAYNGSIPGPTLKVRQGSEITIHFTNDTELETTVHWHGLRLDNRYDGVPEGVHHGHQPPVPVGGTYTYQLRFPDPGVHWYHPHMREDYTQELGLYGNILVVPTAPDYWSPVNREFALMLDDILIENGKIAPFSQTLPTRVAMGRFGNVMLVNGETNGKLDVSQGEVVRLFLTNAANVRIFNLRIPGARMKLIGGDNGRVEHEQWVEDVMIAPSERAIVEVYFENAGLFVLEHRTPDKTYAMAVIEVKDEPIVDSYAQEFVTLRHNQEFDAERMLLEDDFERAPDKLLSIVGEMPGMQHGAHAMEPIEWEDTMAAHNRLTTPQNMFWKLVDPATGKVNHDIDWAFNQGDRVKIRIINEPHSDHPMQHPIHFHGQRFLILSRDGVRDENLMWKDTVLIPTGQTVDLLLDASNPGAWMTHCHIAEHLESHMMLTFYVQEKGTGHEAHHHHG
jgi:FtsP/CotA-like multicopper oxidase with cupredoxin domain